MSPNLRTATPLKGKLLHRSRTTIEREIVSSVAPFLLGVGKGQHAGTFGTRRKVRLGEGQENKGTLPSATTARRVVDGDFTGLLILILENILQEREKRVGERSRDARGGEGKGSLTSCGGTQLTRVRRFKSASRVLGIPFDACKVHFELFFTCVVSFVSCSHLVKV